MLRNEGTAIIALQAPRPLRCWDEDEDRGVLFPERGSNSKNCSIVLFHWLQRRRMDCCYSLRFCLWNLSQQILLRFRFLSAVPIPFHIVPSLVGYRDYLSKIIYITSAVATSFPGSSSFQIFRRKERRPSFLPPPYCRKTRKPWEGVLLSIYFLSNQMKFFIISLHF